MQIQNLEISKIKEDPNQPRKTFNPDKIEELAQTFKTVGIINPIEIDDDYVVITGANRLRAAKSLGWKTIPVKILKLDPKDRFIRQVIENIQYANLTPYETAIALKTLMEPLSLPGSRKGHWNDKGIKLLAEKIGKNKDWVREHLMFLEAPKSLQKAITDGLALSSLRAINQVPKEHQAQFQKKIIAGEFSSRDSALQVAQAINRNPEKSDEILSKDYSKYKTSQEVGEAVAKISPRLSDQIGAGLKAPDRLQQIVKELVEWLDENDPKSVGKLHLPRIMISLGLAEDEINKWKGK